MKNSGKFWINPATGKFESYHQQYVDVNAPAFHPDEIDATVHHGTGKTFTSKHKMERASKEAGLITRSTSEMKNIDFAKKREHLSDPQAIRDTAERAYYAVRDGMAPLSEKEREQCKQENERMKRGG